MGGVLYDGKQLIESRRYDITDIVDRVGSGDSFDRVDFIVWIAFTYNNDKQGIGVCNSGLLSQTYIKRMIQLGYCLRS